MPTPFLKLITATWRTPSSEELWKKLEGLKRRASRAGDSLVLGPALPCDEETRIAEVLVHRHEAEAELHWALTVEPGPSDEPPEAIREYDKKLSGRKGLSTLLAEAAFPGVPAVGAFRVRCLLAEAEVACSVIPSAVERGQPHEPALVLGEARLEQVGYRFEGGGAGGIDEIAIIYLHVQREYSVSIAAKGPLKLNAPRWLPFADDVTELVLSTFFSPRE